MFIYCITNKVNGKCYIGQTSRSVDWRWSQHRRHLNLNFPLAKAIKKYGHESFTVEILAEACSVECLNYLEPLFISFCGSLVPSGYNLDSGGRNNVVHPETVARMSAAQKGRKFSAEHKAKIGRANLGYKASIKARAKLSATKRGRAVSVDEYIEIYKNKHTRKGRSPYCRRGLHLLTGAGRCKECQRVYEKQRPHRVRPPRKRNRRKPA